MPDDREFTGDARMQSDLAGEPLTASVQDVLDEHADAARRADEERAESMADAERMERRKRDEEHTAMRHTGGARRLRPSRRGYTARDVEERGDEERAGQDEGFEREGGGVDPRVLVGAVVAGIVLGGGVRRIVVLGAIAAGAWALYRRVIEPARDPAVVLQ